MTDDEGGPARRRKRARPLAEAPSSAAASAPVRDHHEGTPRDEVEGAAEIADRTKGAQSDDGIQEPQDDVDAERREHPGASGVEVTAEDRAIDSTSDAVDGRVADGPELDGGPEGHERATSTLLGWFDSGAEQHPTAPPNEVRRPSRPGSPVIRFSHAFMRREMAGVAVLVLLGVVCAGLIAAVIVKTRQEAETAAREAAAYTPPALAAPVRGTQSTPSPSPTPTPVQGPLVAVVGDESITGAAAGVEAASRWPRLLGAAMDAKTVSIEAEGAGYAVQSPSGRTFQALVQRVPSDSDVVVLVGGTADRAADSLSIARAASETIRAVRKRAPHAAVVVVGPMVTAGAEDSGLMSIRGALRVAAQAGRARWADPLDEQWVADAATTADLTAADEQAIAARMRAAIEPVLG